MQEEKGDSPDTAKKDSIFQLESWKSDDIKLFVITIAATVAANIFTLILVGIAVIIARSHHNLINPGDYIRFFVNSILAITVSGVFIVGWQKTRTTKADPLKFRAFHWIIGALAVWFSFILSLYVLSWIGFAAGIN